ncbi:MAG: HAD family hydrolase [Sphaerochaetaceae bacterium]|nr:HAD family hydrolase [Sphaerochaetaceae bacterium]
MAKEYKAICFDIDGTLYPLRLMTKYMAHIIFFHPVISRQYRELRSLFRENQADFEKLGLEDQSFAVREAAMYMKVKGGNLKLSEARVLLDKMYYERLEKQYRKLKGQPEVVETLKKIKEAGLKIGVLSDWPLFNKLEQIGVKDMIDVTLNCDDTGYLKPDKRCFFLMLKRLNMKPEEVLYVGDSYKKDVCGAADAGIDAVLINNTASDTKYPRALKVFEDWKGFDSWLREEVINQTGGKKNDK